MAAKPTILAFSGSLREGSYNQKLARIAAAGARAAGAEVTVLDLRDLPMPVYSGDLEAAEGVPENARKLKALLKAHEGFLIASPENNSSISAALKNAIDWASRKEGDEPPLVCFKGKVAVLMAASTGALGGLRGLVHVRAILGNISVLVLPEQRAVPTAQNAFADDGTLKDPRLQQAITDLGTRLVEILRKLAAP
jgi:chromate reductase, NAD(P)H dehydrogenase (quinone)